MITMMLKKNNTEKKNNMKKFGKLELVDRELFYLPFNNRDT